VRPENYPEWDYAYWRIRAGRVRDLKCACGDHVEFCWYVYEQNKEAPRGKRMKAVFHMYCSGCGSYESEEEFVPPWAEDKEWPRI